MCICQPRQLSKACPAPRPSCIHSGGWTSFSGRLDLPALQLAVRGNTARLQGCPSWLHQAYALLCLASLLVLQSVMWWSSGVAWKWVVAVRIVSHLIAFLPPPVSSQGAVLFAFSLDSHLACVYDALHQECAEHAWCWLGLLCCCSLPCPWVCLG